MLLSEKINQLRIQHGYSREKFAQILGVSKEAVENWEAGTEQPEISLLLDSYLRIAEDMKNVNNMKPDYKAVHLWESYSKNLLFEYQQSKDEGLDIEQYKDLFFSVNTMPDCEEKEQIADVLFRIVTSLKYREDYGYVEPSDLQGIKLCRKQYVFEHKNISKDILEEKIHGAWIGRIAGCLLGKTIEGMRTNELIPLLKETNNYPMYRYIKESEVTDEMCDKYQFSLKGRSYADTIDSAPSDDDTNYTVLSQKLIEEYGLDFEPNDVAKMWLAYQPKDAYCTAERVAFRNLVNGYCPPQTAIYKNPYREWIGAQIRTDYYGYINPGDPQKAAEMAWRDASISHVKNGIYGAMFVSAMLACAAVSNDIKDVIMGGLAEIPQKSRLYENVLSIISMYTNGESAKKCFEFIHNTYDEYDEHGWCHTISNAMIVVAALLYGNGDYGKSICMAVETGFDTDCNGATVGSIIGMIYGKSCIDSVWSEPLNGRLRTTLFGSELINIEELVNQTIKHIDLNSK